MAIAVILPKPSLQLRLMALLWADIIILGAVSIVSFAFGWLTFALGYVCHWGYCRKKKKALYWGEEYLAEYIKKEPPTREEFLADQLRLESQCKYHTRNRIDEPQSRMAPTTTMINQLPQSRTAPATDKKSIKPGLYVMGTSGAHKFHLSRQCRHIGKLQAQHILDFEVCDTCLTKVSSWALGDY